MESINALRAVFSDENVIIIKFMYKFVVDDINVINRLEKE